MKSVVLLAPITLTLLLASCASQVADVPTTLPGPVVVTPPQPGQGQVALTNIVAKVYLDTGIGDAGVQNWAPNGSEVLTLTNNLLFGGSVTKGTVGTDSYVNVTLPTKAQLVAGNRLFAIDNATPIDGCVYERNTFSPDTFQGLEANFILTTPTSSTGYQRLEARANKTLTALALLFVDRAVALDVRATCTNGSTTTKIERNLQLVPGWNLVTNEFILSDPNGASFVTYSSKSIPTVDPTAHFFLFRTREGPAPIE